MTEETLEQVLEDYAAKADWEGLSYAIVEGYIDENRLIPFFNHLGVQELYNAIQNIRADMALISLMLEPYYP